MTLGMMQPYFFPYLGYFDLILSSDYWVVFDTDKYKRHGWVSRNRILHPTKGWQYITVPLAKASIHGSIQDTIIHDTLDWRSRILGQIAHYKGKAPFYEATFELVKECLDSKETSISRLNVQVLEILCEFLEIKFNYDYFCELALDLTEINGPGDWALETAKVLKARKYINPAGGKELFDQEAFEDAGITLEIRTPPPMHYDCPGYQFEPNLSILDVLMWNRPEAVRAHLDEHKSAKLETAPESVG